MTSTFLEKVDRLPAGRKVYWYDGFTTDELRRVAEALEDSIRQRHMLHYRHCNCLADSAACCDATCLCHNSIAEVGGE